MNLKPRQITDNQDAVAVVLEGGETLGLSEQFHRIRCSTLSPKGEQFSRKVFTLDRPLPVAPCTAEIGQQQQGSLEREFS